MRVLAIDTALEACAAAVLDTEQRHGGERIAADGARPRRSADAADRPRHAPGGHARSPRSTASPSPPVPAASPGCASASRRRAASRSRRQARRRPDHARRLRRALHRPRRQDRGRRRDRCAASARLSADVRAGRTHARSPRASPASPTRCARPPPARSRIVGTGANMLAAAWPSREPPPTLVDDRRAPDIVWVARLAVAADEGASDAQAALSARARRAAAGRREAAAPMIGMLTRLFARGEPALSEASPRDAAAIAALHAASFRRGWSDGEFERLLHRAQHRRPSRHDRRARCTASSCRGSPAGEAEILSVAVASARRGRGLARALLNLHLRRLAGLGAQRGVPRSRRGQRAGAAALPARRLPRGRPAAGLLPAGPRPGRDRAGAAPRSGVNFAAAILPA